MQKAVFMSRLYRLVERWNGEADKNNQIRVETLNPSGDIIIRRTAPRAVWVKGMLCNMEAEGADVVYDNPSKGVTIVRTWDGNVGSASTINDDQYDHDTGVAVAFAKAQGYKVPDFI